MLPKFVTPHIQGFQSYASRAKSYGRMWGGHAEAVIGEVTIGLSLWFHGRDEETEESLKPQLSVKSVKRGNEYYDAYWHALWDDDHLWLHPNGWFEDAELRKHIPNSNPHLNFRMLPEEKLRELGFVQLV